MDSVATWRTGLHLKVRGLTQISPGRFGVVLLHRIHHGDGGRDVEMVDQEPIAFGEGRASMDGTSWGTTLSLLLPNKQSRTDSLANKGVFTEDASLDWRALLIDGKYQLRWVWIDEPVKSLEEILQLPQDALVDIEGLWEPGQATAKSILYSDFQRR
ncbi:MAG: hypothetical protein FJ308_02340 [Planctomycetes bacterium]|nr:hypothetical protein [Planctomycetota bacterium]